MRLLRSASSAFCRLRPATRRTVSFVSHQQREISSQKPGLFGLRGLHRPEDWQHIADQCVSDCHRLADEIRASRKQPVSVKVLQTFDDLSDRLCSVLDVAELCRQVHPDLEFGVAANDAFLQVSIITKHLNSDYALYEPLSRLLEKHEESKILSTQDSELSPEDEVMVKSLTRDFERGGIHLCETDREYLLSLQHLDNVLNANFMMSSTPRPSTLLLPSSVVNKTPLQFRRTLRPSIENPDHFEVPITSSNASILLKWVSDSRVREKVFRITHSDEQNKRTMLLDEILDTRRKIAKILDRESYAQLLFEDRVASTPEKVSEFLETLSRLLRNRAQQEKHALETEKLKRESHLAKEGRVSLHSWDKSYYIGRLKAQDYATSSFEVSQYLPLSACLDGIAYILNHVFGIKLIKDVPGEGEVWHPDVDKYKLVDTDGALLGEIFMDLYPRKRKYGHAAHFAIRCGRQPADSSKYQTPVVALVCNFGHGNCGKTGLLTISEYETLFHEFGHSLHSLLSRTKYQHLSGTRTPTDFVEIPSHLFEHFAWDPRIISHISRHHKTGDPMPTPLVKGLVASRRGFVSTDLQMQVLFSVMDLQFHGPNPPVGSTTKAFEELQNTLTVYSPDRGIPLPATFHHFVGYGAGYYSYIFARIISAQLWSRLFERDPLSRTGGSILRNEILAYGGARDPVTMLHSVLRGQATCDAFLRNIGIDNTESKGSLRLPLGGASR